MSRQFTKRGIYGVLAVVVVVGGFMLFGPTGILFGSTDSPDDANELDDEISSCTTIDQPGRYVLTENITFTENITSSNSECIKITVSNVILDGQGYTIDGQTNDFGEVGVDIESSIGNDSEDADERLSNITVQNLTVTDVSTGISYSEVTDGHITDTTVVSNEIGIGVLDSSRITLSNNTASNNVGTGIAVVFSIEVTLLNNTISSNWPGISVMDSVGITLSNNTVSYNKDVGIHISDTETTTLSNNTVSNNVESGISITSSTKTTVSNNIVNRNGIGIEVYHTNGATLTGNVLTGNDENGLVIGEDVSNSSVSNNRFNNTGNVRFYPFSKNHSATNAWNVTVREEPNIVGGSRIGGNYYAKSDGTGYSQTCTDQDNDGFCDRPKDFDGNGAPIDELPVALPDDPTLPTATVVTDD